MQILLQLNDLFCSFIIRIKITVNHSEMPAANWWRKQLDTPTQMYAKHINQNKYKELGRRKHFLIKCDVQKCK